MRLAEKLLNESSDEFIRRVAKADRFALRSLINLYNAFRGDDPQLQSKDSKLAMQALLNALSKDDPDRATIFGRMNWEPDALKFAEFLSQIGDQTLAQFLGINSHDDIPSQDTDLESSLEDESSEEPIGDDESDEPDDPELDPPAPEIGESHRVVLRLEDGSMRAMQIIESDRVAAIARARRFLKGTPPELAF